jgi:hypothetical protein
MNHPVNVPVYSNSMSHLPMRLLVEPLKMDAALARLMQPASIPPVSSVQHGQNQESDASWMWIDSGFDAVEVTEHLLPDGIDFLQFHALLSAAH